MDASLAVDSLQAMRTRLEEAVAHHDASARLSTLRDLRREAERTLGLIDTYIADAQLDQEHAAVQESRLLIAARENADIRDEMLRRGIATEEQLDEVGYVSHEQLDEWAEQGVLEEGVIGAVKKVGSKNWGISLFTGRAFNAKVRRDRRGRIVDVIGTPDEVVDPRVKSAIATDVPHAASKQPDVRFEHKAPTKPGSIKKLKGKRGAVKGKEFEVGEQEPVNPQGRIVKPTSKTTTKDGVVTPVASEHLDIPAPKGTMQGQPSKEDLLVKGQKRRARMESELRRRINATEDPEKKAKLQKELDALTARPTYQQTEELGQSAAFDEGVDKLGQRVQRAVGKGIATGALDKEKGVKGDLGTLTTAETHLNEQGHISQKSLLAYVNAACSKPTTTERFRNPDGSWHPSRAEVHARLADAVLRERNPDGSLSFTNPYVEPPTDENGAPVAPTVIFSGGGYAAGKSSAMKIKRAEGSVPRDNIVLLDPDVIKAEIPEFRETALQDPEANLVVYEEAWEIAQMAQKLAQERGLNMLVDGISNTSAEEMARRIKSFTDKGYQRPKAYYVTVPTDTAIDRATVRAKEADTPGDKRHIPEVIMRSVHRDVSATVPELMKLAPDLGLEIQVFNTDQGKDEHGNFVPPKLLASVDPTGNFLIDDSKGWDEFKGKASEALPGVDEGGGKLSDPQPVGKAALEYPEEVRNGLQEANTLLADSPQAYTHEREVGNSYEEAAAVAEEKLAEFKELLGTGIAEATGGAVWDDDFESAVEAVASDPDKTHVIIAGVKGKARSEEKVAKKFKGDWKGLTDMVRGTVLIPNAADMGSAIQQIKDVAAERGWSVAYAENRMLRGDSQERSPGPLSSGYADVQLLLRSPDGYLTELQVNTNAMWDAKDGTAAGFDDPTARESLGALADHPLFQVADGDDEEVAKSKAKLVKKLKKAASGGGSLPGHLLYEATRPIEEDARAKKRPLTPDELDHVNRLNAASQKLYGLAWERSLRGARVKFGTVMDQEGEKVPSDFGDLPKLKAERRASDGDLLYFNTEGVEAKYGVPVTDVSMADITPIRARPEGIRNAAPHMVNASEGKGGKRDPITLVRQPNGKFKVFDGNSTFAMAKHSGWESIPALVVDSEEEAAEIERKMKAGKKKAKK